jgi:hypothetical protein
VKKILICLQHPWLPAIATLLAIGLMLPSLWNGLILEDNLHRLILLGDIPMSVNSCSPLNLFCFIDGNAEKNRQLINSGSLPWWTPEKYKACFFRPLSSLTQWLDYNLWPDTQGLMHVQSLTWFGILVALVALLYRRIMGLTWVAGLAAIFFAVDHTHSAPAGWLANRNALLAGVFGVLCLMAHDRWRREGWRSGAFIGPACLALTLLSAEAGIAIGSYLLAHALILESGPLRRRFTCLIPYGLVLFLWFLLYFLLGCGAQGIPMYTDPFKEPLSYLVAIFFRAPVYLLGQWALPTTFLYAYWPHFIHRTGLIFAVFLILILTPLIRRYRTARFWATGMILSLLPICATYPCDRNLLFVGLGAMGLLAQWFFWVGEVDWTSKTHLWRIAVRTLLVLLILIHAVLNPIVLTMRLQVFALIHRKIERASAILPPGLELEKRKIVLVNNPLYLFFVTNLILLRLVNGQYTPIRVLSSGNQPLIFTRKDLYTIEVRAETGTLTDPDDFFIRSKKFCPGQRVELNDMSVEVLQVNNGLPSAATFLFPVPLENSSPAWFLWQDDGYIPFTLPAVGETIALKGASINWMN